MKKSWLRCEVDPELLWKFKKYCAENRMTMRYAMDILVRRLIKGFYDKK